MSETPLDPVRLTLMDGKEGRFLLTMGAIRRLKVRFGVKTIKDLLDRDVEEAGVPILFEAMMDKTAGLTEDQFAEQLPAHLDSVMSALGQLMASSFPQQPKTRPTPASPEILQ